MRLLNTFKYFSILIFLLFAVLPAQANVNPRNSEKSSADQQISKQQIPVSEQEQEQNKEEEHIANNKKEGEEEGSNSSLNYFFHMIYKVKFENIFKFPDRSRPQNSSGLNLLDINWLVDYFNRPKI